MFSPKIEIAKLRNAETLPNVKPFSVWLVLTLLVVGTAGCAVKLAPDYDKTIVDGIGTLSEETMTFLASVSKGAQKSTFNSEREATYNSLIGKADNLRVQIESRPVPKSQFAQVFGFGPSPDTEVKDLEVLDAPSGDSMKTISETLTQMKSTDLSKGLNETNVKLFRVSIELSLDQALTYEKALER